MDNNLKVALDAMAAAPSADKVKLGALTLAHIDPSQYEDLFQEVELKQLLHSTPKAVENLAGELAKTVPEKDKPAVAKAVVDQLSESQKKALAQAVLGPPSEKTRDSLWLIVIWALVIVMLVSVLVLAINVFMDKSPMHESRVSPEVMLSLFTSVFGFLVGLFVPSPSKGKGDGE